MLPQGAGRAMVWVWDKAKNEMHNAANARPECKLDAIPAGQRREYQDEITATTVLKTQHLIPCRFCYRPMGRSHFEPVAGSGDKAGR
jgi:hypothetical protein